MLELVLVLGATGAAAWFESGDVAVHSRSLARGMRTLCHAHAHTTVLRA